MPRKPKAGEVSNFWERLPIAAQAAAAVLGAIGTLLVGLAAFTNIFDGPDNAISRTGGAGPRDSEAATVDVPNADGDEPLAQAHAMPATERPLVQRVTNNITALLNRQATDPMAAQNFQHVSRAFGVDSNKPAGAQAEDAIDAVVELSVTPGALETLIAALKAQHGVDLGQ